jgi:hypothetical protein
VVWPVVVVVVLVRVEHGGGVWFRGNAIVRLAPRWWHLRSTVRAADERLAHVNLLASG